MTRASQHSPAGQQMRRRDGNSMNMKRMRGRGHRPGGGGGGGGGGMRHHGGGSGGGIPLNRNHVFDSNGPDLRIRGTSQQLFEKYLQLGRDATSGGDRVMAESYFQHAEHYFRILNAMNQAAQQGQPNGQQQNGQQRAARRRRGRQPAGSGEARGGRGPCAPAPATSRRPARSRSPPPRPRPELTATLRTPAPPWRRRCRRSASGAPAPSPADRRLAEALTQRVDRRLGGGTARRLGIGQIAAIGLRQRQQRIGADADQPEGRAGRLARQQRAGGLEQPVGQHGRARQPAGARADREVRRLQLQHHAAGGQFVLLQPPRQLLGQPPEMRLQIGRRASGRCRTWSPR